MKNKNFILLLLFLVIGFASISTTLLINGITNISSNNDDFDVYFSNAIENGTTKRNLIKDETRIVFTVDMSLVGERYVLDYDVTNGSRNYDAELTINYTNSNEYLKITNEFDTSTNLLATETRSGKLVIEIIKPYVGTEEEPTKNMDVSCTIVANAVERDTIATGTPADKVKSAWLIAKDNDNNGVLSNGDLITLESESFYVYDIDGDNVKAIAQYNLYVGNDFYRLANGSIKVSPLENPTGMQDESAGGYNATNSYKGVLAFDSRNNSDYETSEIKKYVDAYGEVLKELDGNINRVRLITKEELEKAGCDSVYKNCTLAPAYLKSTSYWTSSFNEENTYGVWHVFSNNQLNWYSASYNYENGVRPVIELPLSLF